MQRKIPKNLQKAKQSRVPTKSIDKFELSVCDLHEGLP